MNIIKLSPPLFEKEITEQWIYSDVTYVSIICCTYNQDKYISDAINSFLAQKTQYKFEIIIHDDCSTDKTNDILMSFKKNFPNIIKIINPKENLYSKYGVNAPGLNAISYSLGKYIAFCEGDDFWIYNNKIQIQLEQILIDPNISLCIHRSYLLKHNSYELWNESDHGDEKKLLTIENILNVIGQFAPTSSYLIKREVINILPEWFNNAPVGDFFLEIYSTKIGRILYLPEIMSVYRQYAGNSWSIEVLRNEKNKIIFNKKMLYIYNILQLDDFRFEKICFEKRIKYSYITNIKSALILKDSKVLREEIESFLKYKKLNKTLIFLFKILIGNKPIIYFISILFSIFNLYKKKREEG